MFSFATISEVVTDLRDVGHIAPAKHSDITMTNGAVDSQGWSQKRKFVEITMETPLRALSRFFEWNSAAVVTERDGVGSESWMKPVAVVTKVDLLGWLVRQGKMSEHGAAAVQE